MSSTVLKNCPICSRITYEEFKFCPWCGYSYFNEKAAEESIPETKPIIFHLDEDEKTLTIRIGPRVIPISVMFGRILEIPKPSPIFTDEEWAKIVEIICHVALIKNFRLIHHG